MGSFSRIGELVRQHYEKIALIAALLILAAAVFLLYQASQRERARIDSYVKGIQRRTGATIKPVDLSRLQAAIEKAQTAPAIELAGAHNLANPVKWYRKPDGSLIKSVTGIEGTLDQLQVGKITPLLFYVGVDRYTGTGFQINFTNQVISPRGRPQYVSLNNTNTPVFVLREIKGAPEEAGTELILELKESGERIAVSKNQPYVRTNSFEVDLKYNVTGRSFDKQRVGKSINLSGEEYKIVAIASSEVVLSAANDKKYTVRQSGAR